MTALRDRPVLVVDCQSTGATPAQGQVLEIGWACLDPRSSDAPVVEARLVAQPEGRRLSRILRELTGLIDEDLVGAPAAGEVWSELEAARAALGPAPTPTIIHFATFERRFLEDWSSRFGARDDLPFEIVCTHEVAKRLLPDLPRRGLRALAGYFGFSSTQLRRSADHVAATCFVYRHLLDALETEGVESWEGLRALLAKRPPKRSKKRKFPMPREVRLGLPAEPGVYRFKRTNGDVLYVGKATSLKSRVNSHFTKQSGLSDRQLELLSQARDLEFTVCATPLEAALLETDEIKAHEPPYNVALLDEGRRQVVYAARDLRSVDPHRSPAHPVGPLGSQLAIAPLTTIQDMLAAPEAERSTYVRARALGIMPASAPEDAVWQDGLTLFSEAHGFELGELSSVGRLLGLGARLYAAGGLERKARPDEDEVVWDPERVREHFEIAVARAAQHVHRARWLRRLGDASVAYAEPGADVDRLLVLRGTEIVERDALAADAPLPSGPVGAGVDFDVTRYDRLRVLMTELKRVVRDGGRVRVRFGARPVLEGAALSRSLRLV